MKKFTINGRQYIRLSTLRHEIDRLKKTIDIRHGGFSDYQKNAMKVAYGDIIRFIYREELNEALKHAHTPDEIRAVHQSIYDMPGDFIVCKKRKGKGDISAFVEWASGGAVIGAPEEAMIFSYESKAQEIAELLNDSEDDEHWTVVDMSEEAYEDAKRLLDAIFSDDETEEAQ